MYPYPRRPSRPKLPRSGPPTPPRREIVLPVNKRGTPSAQALDEVIDLAPPFLQEWLRTEVPRELHAEAARAQTIRRTTQTSFLERSADAEAED